MLERDFLRRVSELQGLSWSGEVWRHILGDRRPEVPNDGGARWNPRGVLALYTSVARETAIAEGTYRIAMQPVASRVRRTLFRMNVRLHSVVDARDSRLLASFGIDREALNASPSAACEQFGHAVYWLGHDGLIVPSARHDGMNLVIYMTRMTIQCELSTAGFEVLDLGSYPAESR